MLTFNGFLDERIQNKYINRLTKRLMNDNNYNNNNNNNNNLLLIGRKLTSEYDQIPLYNYNYL